MGGRSTPSTQRTVFAFGAGALGTGTGVGAALGAGGEVKVSGKATNIAPVMVAGIGNGMPSIFTRRCSTASERSSLGPLTLMTTGLSRGESRPRPGVSPVFSSMIW